MGNGEGAFIQGYNAQAAVDSTHQIIVGIRLTNQASDAQQLVPMVDEVRRRLGCNPAHVSADSGYCSEDNLEVLSRRKLEAFVATGRMHRRYRQPPPPRGRTPDGLTQRQRMTRKLLTARGSAIYRLRQQVVEPVFGQIKNKGLDRLLLRGEDKARAEWTLHGFGHNLTEAPQGLGVSRNGRRSRPRRADSPNWSGRRLFSQQLPSDH